VRLLSSRHAFWLTSVKMNVPDLRQHHRQHAARAVAKISMAIDGKPLARVTAWAPLRGQTVGRLVRTGTPTVTSLAISSTANAMNDAHFPVGPALRPT